MDKYLNRRNRMNGLELMAAIPDGAVAVSFFDPQYRGVMDHLKFGNEGARQKGRALLEQMDEDTIKRFIAEIDRVLRPSGHLMLWVDKFHLVTGVGSWLEGTSLRTVDLITWEKPRIGMGRRTRRKCEYLLVAQKLPMRAKGCWTRHDIPDVIAEKAPNAHHPHAKPLELQRELILATTKPGDLVLDPASGGWSVMASCANTGRDFIGADLADHEPAAPLDDAGIVVGDDWIPSRKRKLSS